MGRGRDQTGIRAEGEEGEKGGKRRGRERKGNVWHVQCREIENQSTQLAAVAHSVYLAIRITDIRLRPNIAQTKGRERQAGEGRGGGKQRCGRGGKESSSREEKRGGKWVIVIG